MKKVALLLDWIKFQHSLFAMPFALMSAGLAAEGRLPGEKLIWIVLAMLGARSSAMGFNRIVDREIDAANPRTRARHLPANLLGLGEAWAFVLVSALLLCWSAGRLNRLALLLSPLALAVVWGYSFTKRFTSLSHLVLGAALGIAPVAAWIGITGTIGPPSCLIALAVTLWTAGFDILYSCQDVEFDRGYGLHSLPARWGIPASLRISEALHAAMFLALALLPASVNASTGVRLGPLYLFGLGVTGVLLLFQHRLVRPDDLSRLDAAFFTANGAISVALCFFTLLDVYI